MTSASKQGTTLNEIKPKSTDEKVRDLAKALDGLGLLDALIGALSDSSTVAAVVSTFASDDSISLLMNLPKMLAFLSKVDPERLSGYMEILASDSSANSLSKIMKLISLLDNRGIIDLVAGVLKDEEAFGYAVKLLSDDAFFSILLNAPKYVDVISKLNPEVLNTVSQVTGIMGRNDIRPVRGAMSVMHELRDENVAAGLGKIFEMLRELGKASRSQ